MDWKAALATVAPALATALGGPLAGVAAAAISDALIGKPSASEGEIAIALTAGGPDALLKLKQADQAFAQRMRELDIDVYKIDQTDRANARESNVKAGIQGYVFVLVLLIFATVLGLEGSVLFLGVPNTVDGQIVGRILGTLDAVLLAALYYVFGSSAGSARKDELMAKR